MGYDFRYHMHETTHIRLNINRIKRALLECTVYNGNAVPSIIGMQRNHCPD